MAEPGRELPEVRRSVDQQMVTAYANASGDHNPIHLDADFAARTQFGAIVAHGMLTLAFIGQMMHEAFGAAWQEQGTLKVRFKGPAYPGDKVTTFGNVVRETAQESQMLVECSVGLRNQDGVELISGTASVRLPLPNGANTRSVKGEG